MKILSLLTLLLLLAGCTDAFYDFSEKTRAKRAECRDFISLNYKQTTRCVNLVTGDIIEEPDNSACRRFSSKVNECAEHVDLVDILRHEPMQPIHIGVVWPKDTLYGQMVAGATLAQEEINQKGGILGGRPIQLWDYDDTPNIADSITSNLDLLAIIGHRTSATALPASITYEYRGLLFLAPRATRMALTTHNFQHVFRSIPNSKQMGAQLAHFTKWSKHKNIVILYSRDAYAEEVASEFYENAVDIHLNVVHRASFFEYRSNFRSIIADFRGKKFDAIFLATWPKAAAQLMKQTRDMGIRDVPFIGVDAMDSPLLSEIAGDAAEGTVVPTVYDARAVTSLDSLRFIENFQKRFNQTPDTWAAQGYDGVKLLAHAMEDSKSSVPLVVATSLRYLRFWLGVTGVYRFDRSGDITGKLYKFNVLKDGKFETISSAHIFYALDKIQKDKLKVPLQ